jgi:outer membrane protein
MLEVSRGARYPTLSLGASYSNSYYDHSGYVNPSLKDQLSSNGRSNIGLSLSVPIFNRLSTSNNIKRSNINLETARLQLENTKKMLYKEIQQAWFNAMTAEEKYQASFETIRATEEAFRFTEEKFNNGRSTMYEYNEARMQLLKTRSEQVQAKYNLMFSLKILDFYRGNSISL